MGRQYKNDDEENNDPSARLEEDVSVSQKLVPVAVVEQRVSNLAQGAMCLILLTGPFLHVLHLIPRGSFLAL